MSIKKLKKLHIFLILIALIMSIGAVFAYSYFADEISYRETDVESALDDLYEKLDSCYIGVVRMIDLIPIMTSNTAPSGEIDYSSYWSGRDPWHAFSRAPVNIGDASTFWLSSAQNNEWVSYTWDSEIEMYLISWAQINAYPLRIQYKKNNNWINLYYSDILNASDNNSASTYTISVGKIKTDSIKFETPSGYYGFLSNVHVYGKES